jgi:hypothetical protein
MYRAYKNIRTCVKHGGKGRVSFVVESNIRVRISETSPSTAENEVSCFIETRFDCFGTLEKIV